MGRPDEKEKKIARIVARGERDCKLEENGEGEKKRKKESKIGTGILAYFA
jgi:hypothetical protein